MNLPFRALATRPATPPIPHPARPWIEAAAHCLGLKESDARHFVNTGVLELPGLFINLQLWRDLPFPQWHVLAQLVRPDDVSSRLWNELLLRSNCAINAMSACAAAIDEYGDAVLINRLAAVPYTDARYLADQLALVIAVAESLTGGATALATAGHGPELHPSSSVSLNLPPNILDHASLAVDWHTPLLAAALRRLGGTQPIESVEAIGVCRIGDQSLEIIADSDCRHLIVSTGIVNVLRTDSQRTVALRANLELMALTGCTVALTPHGACLQGRWDSQGLDGDALGDWLGDFAAFASTLVAVPAVATSATRIKR